MFWHYGIPLGHVSIEPDLTRGYGGVTVPSLAQTLVAGPG
jgi:hypothetical protein